MCKDFIQYHAKQMHIRVYRAAPATKNNCSILSHLSHQKICVSALLIGKESGLRIDNQKVTGKSVM